MNNPFPWLGSKRRLSGWIISNMPPHRHYVEVFGGTGAVLLNKEPSEIEIFNDINEGITNFFSVVRDRKSLNALKQKLHLSIYNEKDFHLFKHTWQKEENLVEKAFKWYYVAQLSFSGIWGKGPRFALSGIGNVPATISQYLSSIENLEHIYARMRNVQVLNRDWKKVLRTFDSKDTLFLLDPPYLPETRVDGSYPEEMTQEGHVELIEALLETKSKAIVCGYKNSIYNRLLKYKWKILQKKVSVTCSHDCSGNSFSKGSRTECLYIK